MFCSQIRFDAKLWRLVNYCKILHCNIIFGIFSFERQHKQHSPHPNNIFTFVCKILYSCSHEMHAASYIPCAFPSTHRVFYDLTCACQKIRLFKNICWYTQREQVVSISGLVIYKITTRVCAFNTSRKNMDVTWRDSSRWHNFLKCLSGSKVSTQFEILYVVYC